MGTLSNCLKVVEVGTDLARQLKRRYKEYRSEGNPRASLAAVDDMIRQTEQDRASVMSQLPGAGGASMAAEPLPPLYHGTRRRWAEEPGAPLGKFDLEQVGSGQGQAAYGWGMNTSNSRLMAESYTGRDYENRDKGSVYTFPMGIDRETLLNRDEPISAQPVVLEKLRASQEIQDLFREKKPDGAADLDTWVSTYTVTSGDSLYGVLREALGTPRQASEMLARAGIPGQYGEVEKYDYADARPTKVYVFHDRALLDQALPSQVGEELAPYGEGSGRPQVRETERGWEVQDPWYDPRTWGREEGQQLPGDSATMRDALEYVRRGRQPEPGQERRDAYVERAIRARESGMVREPEAGYAQNEQHDAWRVNMDSVPEAARPFVRQVVENDPFPDYEASWTRRRTTDVMAEADRQLRDSRYVQDLLGQAPDTAVKDQVLAELSKIYSGAALEVSEAHENYARNPNDKQAEARFLAAQVRYNAIHGRMFGAKTEAGRALGILRQIKNAMLKADPTAAVRAALEDRGISVSEDELAALRAIPPGDTRALMEWQRNILRDRTSWGKTAKNWLTSYRMFNMLFNSSTQGANLFSNALKTTLDIPVDVMEALLAKDRTLAGVARYYSALLKGIPDSILSALGTLHQGVSDFELRHGLSSGTAGEQAASELKGGGYNPINWGARVTRAGDVLFRDAHYLAETDRLAFMDAAAKGLTGTDLEREIERLKLSGRYHQAATDRANRATFQEDSPTLRKLLKAINAVPGLRWVLPFVKTPYNINAAGLRMLPGFGFLFGKMQGERMSRVAGEQMVGAALTLGLGYILAEMGRATSGAPTDPAEREKFFQGEKKEPYSVKIGNQWVRYSRLGPVALPIVAGVAAQEYLASGAEDKNAQAAIGKMVGKVGKMIGDQSMLMGLDGLAKAVNEPDRYGEQFLKNMGGQLVPGASLQRQVTRATEDEVLETGDWLDKLAADLPEVERNWILEKFGRTPLGQRVDTLGRPQTYRGGGWQAWVGWVKGAEAQDDPVVQELLDLGVKYPTAISDAIQTEMEDDRRAAKEIRLGRPLTKQEMRVAGELSRDELTDKRRQVGQALYRSLQATIRSPQYQAKTPVQKATALNKVIGARRKAVTHWNKEHERGE